MIEEHLRDRRVEKMNRIIKEELDTIFQKSIQWKSGILVTIVNVETSVDLKYAKAFVSVLPETNGQYVMKTLENEQHTIKSMLFSRLKRKIIPEIHFVIHGGGQHQTRVDELLKEIHTQL